MSDLDSLLEDWKADLDLEFSEEEWDEIELAIRQICEDIPHDDVPMVVGKIARIIDIVGEKREF